MSVDAFKIVCTPWCEDGDGHPDAGGREDQNCWGPADYTPLTLEEIAQDSYGVMASQLGVMAYRGFNEHPTVQLHLDLVGDSDLDRILNVTVAEARALAAALLKVANDIEGVR